MDAGSLDSFLAKRWKRIMESSKHVVRDIVDGMVYLHGCHPQRSQVWNCHVDACDSYRM